MKKITVGALSIALLGILAYGAVKTVVIDPKTVSSVDEILEVFYQTRNSLPPLPCPVSYETISEQLADGRVDFIASPNWAYNHDGGTYYLSEDSKLAEKLLLPATLLAYEDLASGKVVLACIPNATGKLQSLAVVDAPMLAPFDESVSFDNYLIKEYWPRRIVWTATLKPVADAWADLLWAESENSLLRSAGSAPLAASIPEGPPEGFNGIPDDYAFEIGIESSSNQVQVGWYGLSGFSYQLQGSDNLITSAFADMGGSHTGSNAGIVVEVSPPTNHYFFKVEATALDGDGDGLPDCWEYHYFGATNLYGASDDPDLDGLLNALELDAATQPGNPDSDGDEMWDHYEVYYEFDPLDGALFHPDDTGPEDDFDSDGVINIDEYNQGSFPHRSDFGLSETNGMVKWFGQVDWIYQLQGSDTNLATGNWSDLGVSLLGENKEIQVDVSSYAEAYFRVAVSGYDSDGDGLINVLEREHGTDEDNPDSDGDGMWDHYEAHYGFDPLNGAISQTGDAGPKDDLDGDGISNIDEYNRGSFPDRSDFSLSETNNAVEWFGQFGWHYQLQGAMSSAATNWVDLGSSMEGDNQVFSVDTDPYSQTHFRVEVTGIDLLQEGSYTSTVEVVYGSTNGSGRYSAGNLTPGYAFDRRANLSALFNNASNQPINGRLVIPKDPAAMGAGEKFPLAIIVHGWASMSIESELGYIYLCEHLASHGIMAATIDETFLNLSKVAGENDARAVLLLEHVKQFGIWNSDTNHPLYNKVDMSRIMLVGHSRGGEAVELASYFNKVADEDSITGIDFDAGEHGLGPYHFNLGALVAIAPTEGRYIGKDENNDPVYITEPVADNYFIIHGSKDGDVDDFKGYKTYERAHPVDLANPLNPAEGCKGLLWVYKANHKRFNTAWGNGISYSLTDEQHEDIAKYYCVSIAYATLYGCDYGFSAFRDNHYANTFLPGIDLVTQYQDATRRLINHYDDDDDPATPSDPHDGTNTWSCVLSEINFINDVQEFDNDSLGTNDAACMEWSTTGKVYTVTLDTPLDAGPYNVLSFRIAQYYAQDDDIQIDLEVGNGVASGEFDLSDYVTVRYPAETEFEESQNEGDRRVVMQTVRIPLAAIAAEGVDIHSIKGIKLKFSTPDGIIYFDDLQLSK